MAPSAHDSSVRHDDLMRRVKAAGHAFAPVEDHEDEGPSRSRFLAASALSISGMVMSCGVLFLLG